MGSQRVWPDWTAEHRHVWDLRSMTRGWTHSLCIGRRSLTHQATWEGTSLFLIFSPLLPLFLLPVFMFLKHSLLRRGTQTTLQPPRRYRDCPPPTPQGVKITFVFSIHKIFFRYRWETTLLVSRVKPWFDICVFCGTMTAVRCSTQGASVASDALQVMDCSPLGSSVHAVSRQGYGVGCHALFQEVFLTQGSNLRLLCLLRCRGIHYCWATGAQTTIGLSLYHSSHMAKIVFLGGEFSKSTLSNFQISNSVLLTVVTRLCITLSWLISIWKFVPFDPFTSFAHFPCSLLLWAFVLLSFF